MAWQVGDTIGAYRLEAVLGSGGMATVYRAYHERLARAVAIKVLHPAMATDADFLSRFEREARIVANLDHPHIVPVYDFDDADGQPYLVMKYIEGQTLKAVFQRGALPLDDIVRITDALADALTYAHEQGVLHRDIKPGNVIMDRGGTPYLTDFGLARMLQTGESTMSAGMIIGTPNYVSPEQASGDREVTGKTDVYSLGVLLYEMVVGRVPFSSATPYATVHKHIYEPPPLPSELNPEIPTQVEMVLLSALDKDPAKRPATPNALAAAFKEAVRASGLTALSPERSQVYTSNDTAPDALSPAPAVDKPKRDDSGERSLLLLLEDEDSLSHLPQDEIIRRRLKKRRDERMGFIAHLMPYLMVNALILWMGSTDGDGLSAYSLITPLAWGAGLLAHGVHVFFQSGRHVETMYRTFDEQMTNRYGVGWRDALPEDTIRRAWEGTRETFEERNSFYVHAAVYLLINLMLWAIWVGTLGDGDGGFPWPLFVNGGWGIGLVSHGLKVYTDRQSGGDDESVAAELAMMQGVGSGKRKNEDAPPPRDGVRLTEDGELTESTVADFEQQQRGQRR